jgi:hypothetical protein
MPSVRVVVQVRVDVGPVRDLHLREAASSYVVFYAPDRNLARLRVAAIYPISYLDVFLGMNKEQTLT